MNKIKRFFVKVHENILKKLESDQRKELTTIENKYWSQILLLQAQTDGLMLGFNQRNETKITIGDVYLMNGDGEISELVNVFSNGDYFEEGKNGLRYKIKKNHHLKEKKENFIGVLFKKYGTRDWNRIWRMLETTSHCSALIKLLKDENHHIKDVLISHSTWDSYSEMLRIYKKFCEKNEIYKRFHWIF